MKSHLKVDLIQNISLQISTLKFFHVWFFIPYSIKSLKFWLAVFIRLVLGVFVFIIPTLTQFIYVVRLMRADSPQIQEIASVINLVLTEALASLKLADLRSRRHVLTQLTDQLISEEFYCFDEAHKRILEKGIKFSRRIYIGLLFVTAMDVLFHVVVSPAFHRFESLPLKMDFIYFDVSDPAYFNYFCAYQSLGQFVMAMAWSVYYFSNYISVSDGELRIMRVKHHLQILYKPCMVTVYVVLQTMTWSFMFCANSQLDVLINKLENMKELIKITKTERGYDENKAFEEMFKSLVLHHAAILRFTKTFQAAFGGQLSMSLFVSSCIIGTTAVQIFSIESPRKNITEVIWVLAYLSIFIANLFVECYLGNAITYKCALIPTLVFAGPWLDLSLKMKRNLVLFIAKTQQPVVLVAAKLAPVSIDTFTKIMNWTYKGFAVLNQMKK